MHIIVAHSRVDWLIPDYTVLGPIFEILNYFAQNQSDQFLNSCKVVLVTLTSLKRLIKVTDNSLVMCTTSMISQPKKDFQAYHDYAHTTFAARCMVTLILG